MPERTCQGCRNQARWGCEAERIKEPEPGEFDDPVENWRDPAQDPVSINGEDSYACPRQTLRREPRAWSKLLLLYGMYSKGHLPDRGAVVDQSNSLLEAFRIIDDVNAECDKIQSDRDKARRARENRHGARR